MRDFFMQNSSYGFGVEIPSAEQPNYQLSINFILNPNLLKILDN